MNARIRSLIIVPMLMTWLCIGSSIVSSSARAEPPEEHYLRGIHITVRDAHLRFLGHRVGPNDPADPAELRKIAEHDLRLFILQVKDLSYIEQVEEEIRAHPNTAPGFHDLYRKALAWDIDINWFSKKSLDTLIFDYETKRPMRNTYRKIISLLRDSFAQDLRNIIRDSEKLRHLLRQDGFAAPHEDPLPEGIPPKRHWVLGLGIGVTQAHLRFMGNTRSPLDPKDPEMLREIARHDLRSFMLFETDESDRALVLNELNRRRHVSPEFIAIYQEAWTWAQSLLHMSHTELEAERRWYENVQPRLSAYDHIAQDLLPTVDAMKRRNAL